MSRLKTLALLACIIATLTATMTTPASGWFKAVGTAERQAKGLVIAKAAGEFTGTDEAKPAHTAIVKCPAGEIQGEWSIQTKGQIKIHNREEKQILTNEGPHLNVQVKWGHNCEAAIGGTTFKAGEIKIPQCELQLAQQKGSEKATAGVVTGCRVEVPTCTIIVPAGMEKEPGSNEGINVGLKEVSLVNSGNNMIGVGPTIGIFAYKQANASCPLTTDQKIEVKGFEFEAKNVNAI
jgi:hypothetical protein